MVNQRNLTAVYRRRLKSQLSERGKLEKSQTDINRVGIERFKKLVRTEQGDLIVELWVDLMSSGQQLRQHRGTAPMRNTPLTPRLSDATSNFNP